MGAVAIYRDELPVKPANASSPDAIAALFRKAGYGVTFLDSKALCVPEIFNRRNFDVFVQPYERLSRGKRALSVSLEWRSPDYARWTSVPAGLMFDFEGKLVDAGYDLGITTERGAAVGLQTALRRAIRDVSTPALSAWRMWHTWRPRRTRRL